MTTDSPRIRVLSAEVARKIAAGEVIERPHGVVRELLDNALDADATRVDVEIDGGGLDLIRVTDNGIGMSAADLALCWRPHATSKIVTDDDLRRVTTLGFRGEALSSIAAVSRLTLRSATASSVPHEIRVEAGIEVSARSVAANPGTSVEVAELFYNVPARKSFLRNPASESALIRNTFLDKAIAFANTRFRLVSSGQTRHALDPSDSITRICDAYQGQVDASRCTILRGSGEGFSFEIVAGEPSAYRKDRKHVQVFVNRRRIWEYALVQALEYPYRDYLHGGLHPVAYLFLTVEPQLVDFNVHPTKREARFRDLPAIHRRVVDVLGGHLTRFDHRATMVGGDLFATHPAGGRAGAYAEESGAVYRRAPSIDSGSQTAEPRVAYDLTRTLRVEPGDRVGARSDSVEPAAPHPGYSYHGQIMDLFLVVSSADSLFLIDQHAAHERIVYDRLRNGCDGQELIFPVRLEVDDAAGAALEANAPFLRRLGIGVEHTPEGWELVSSPTRVSIAAEELAALLMELIDRPADFERELYASLACRSAVMDGDRLSDERAIEVIDAVFGLENARCPHGRPIWIELSKQQLMELVGRT